MNLVEQSGDGTSAQENPLTSGINNLSEAIKALTDMDFSLVSGEVNKKLQASLDVLGEVDARINLAHAEASLTPEQKQTLDDYSASIQSLREGVDFRQKHRLPSVSEQARRVRIAFASMNTPLGYNEVFQQLLQLSQQPDATDELATLREEAAKYVDRFEELDDEGLLELDVRELYQSARDLQEGSALLGPNEVVARLSTARALFRDLQRAEPLFQLFKQERTLEQAKLFVIQTLRGLSRSMQDSLIFHTTSRDGMSELKAQGLNISELSTDALEQHTTALEQKISILREEAEREAQPDQSGTSHFSRILSRINAVFVRPPTRTNAEGHTKENLQREREIAKLEKALAVITSEDIRTLATILETLRGWEASGNSTN